MSEAKGTSKSVALAVEKARELRVQRLRMGLDGKLDNPMMVVDQLMAEIADGDPQTELWEKFHAAAIRDKREREVGDAYQRAIGGPRMKRLSPQAQADILMHAADFFVGIRGEPDVADEMLWKVLAVTPQNEEAFSRLEKRLEKAVDEKKLVELYATVAATPPRKLDVLAQQALLRLVHITPATPLHEDVCKKLVALAAANPKVLEVLETHCKATKRAALAAEVIETALADDVNAKDDVTKARRLRAIELYFGEAATPAKAIDHVEKVLGKDPTDAVAFKAGEKLMSLRDVSSKAAAALQKARRARSQ